LNIDNNKKTLKTNNIHSAEKQATVNNRVYCVLINALRFHFTQLALSCVIHQQQPACKTATADFRSAKVETSFQTGFNCYSGHDGWGWPS
jgi:hypothetical protein